jgi:hypothetical protein
MKYFRCIIFIIIVSFYAFANCSEISFKRDNSYSAELYISQRNIKLNDIINKLPNKNAWDSFLRTYDNTIVYIDLRSGKPSSIITSIPISSINKNHTNHKNIFKESNYKTNEINSEQIEEFARKFISQYAGLLGINTEQIDNLVVNQINEYLWHVYIARQINGIKVKDSIITMTINHSNLILLGVKKWGDIRINTQPLISAEQAMNIIKNIIMQKGIYGIDKIYTHELIIIPTNPVNWNGQLGKGYEYKLAWHIIFKESDKPWEWEAIIDASNHKLYYFSNIIQEYGSMQEEEYNGKIIGSVYPESNNGCSDWGSARENTPMIFMDIRPTLFQVIYYSNLGGLFYYSEGKKLSTSLSGKYAKVEDMCCSSSGNEQYCFINEPAIGGVINLGGANGQHDCDISEGHNQGNTMAARTCAYEVSKLNRIAKGWLEYNEWLDNVDVVCKVNIDGIPCFGGASGPSKTIYASRSGVDQIGTICSNYGEIASIIDHEWAHVFDYWNGWEGYSNPSEAIADIMAILAQHSSCISKGAFIDMPWQDCVGYYWTCPENSSIAHPHSNYYGCGIECPGLREHDYEKLSPLFLPYTPTNHTCPSCDTSDYLGPCSKRSHCEAMTIAQAIWDLATRDFQNNPFNYDEQTSLELTTRLSIIANSLIGDWYSCDCVNLIIDSCNADSGYLSFLAVDDDDGNLTNGTPHMEAIFNAFNRHGIACSDPPLQNSGCQTRPSTAPILYAEPTPDNKGIFLNWNSVPNAAKYYLFRADGPLSCNQIKIKIATIENATSYIDKQISNGVLYYYTILPVGENTACLGIFSNCISSSIP